MDQSERTAQNKKIQPLPQLVVSTVTCNVSSLSVGLNTSDNLLQLSEVVSIIAVLASDYIILTSNYIVLMSNHIVLTSNYIELTVVYTKGREYTNYNKTKCLSPRDSNDSKV